MGGSIEARRVAGGRRLAGAAGAMLGAAFVVAYELDRGALDAGALIVGLVCGAIALKTSLFSEDDTSLDDIRTAAQVGAVPPVEGEAPRNLAVAAVGPAAACLGIVSFLAEVWPAAVDEAIVAAVVSALGRAAEWAVLRRAERDREGIAVELRAEDADDEAQVQVVLYRPNPVMTAFGR
ncbi:hypothetical protein LRS13_02695 [Svornostia abyssi]|uniref:Uncharacterized protein n=1 Tax=Svornostia abyssi TaxID=2898438 RepID=A0ABY5PJ62_9ACTN|nr:hypothetical protein LRS13_02695 [Parviterribacteraceae bacterium J379]